MILYGMTIIYGILAVISCVRFLALNERTDVSCDKIVNAGVWAGVFVIAFGFCMLGE